MLHVATWQAGKLVETIARVNAKGYGLTMGLHSRIARAGDVVEAEAAVGNLYVNRSMIGAVVGSQPFGGEGLSGTGPEGGRAALPLPLRRRAGGVGGHDLGRRERDAAVARRGRDLARYRRRPARPGHWSARRSAKCRTGHARSRSFADVDRPPSPRRALCRAVGVECGFSDGRRHRA